jgi:hypothetical protein
MNAISMTPFIRVMSAIERGEPSIRVGKIYSKNEVPYFEELQAMLSKYGYALKWEYEDVQLWHNPKLEKKKQAMQKYFDKMRKKIERG